MEDKNQTDIELKMAEMERHDDGLYKMPEE